jgi:hypothetical protein
MSTKAAENRHLLPVILQLCREYSDRSPRDNMRTRCAENLVRLQTILTEAGTHLSELEKQGAITAMYDAFDAYSRLSAYFAQIERSLVFNIVNKFHFMVHLVLRSGDINPNLAWTYPWEDLIGRAQRVAAACASGRSATQVGPAFLNRYRRVLHTALL